MKLTPRQIAARKAVETRNARKAMQAKYPIGYEVAKLASQGFLSRYIAEKLFISEYQARGYMTRVTRGEYNSCNF